MRRWRTASGPRAPLLLLLLAQLPQLGSAAGAAPAPAPAHRVLGGVQRLLQFLADNQQALLPDILFGMVLTEGQLYVVKRHLETNVRKEDYGFLMEHVTDTEVQLQKILNNSLSQVVLKDDEKYNKMVRGLLRPERWRVAAPMRRLRARLRPRPLQRLPRERLLRLQYGGLPDESTSDACLAEVVRRPARGRGGSRCRVSRRCRDAELGPARSRGYPLTHRLLWLQAARQVGCGYLWNQTKVTRLVEQFCSDILADAQLIEFNGFPLFSQDLFAEQVALCGIEGFLDFTKPEWLATILSWQRPEGCFGDRRAILDSVRGSPSRRGGRLRVRREEAEMAHGCLMHFSGVAAAALAAGLRPLLLAPPGASCEPSTGDSATTP